MSLLLLPLALLLPSIQFASLRGFQIEIEGVSEIRSQPLFLALLPATQMLYNQEGYQYNGLWPSNLYYL